MINKKKTLHKALRISRGLALATGAVVTSALVLGAATTALAAAPGDPFRLGQVNVINKVTKLVGKATSRQRMRAKKPKRRKA